MQKNQRVAPRSNATTPNKAVQIAPSIPTKAHGYISDGLSSHQSFDAPHVLSRHVTNEFIQTSNYVQKFMLPQGIIDKMSWFLTKKQAAGSH